MVTSISFMEDFKFRMICREIFMIFVKTSLHVAHRDTNVLKVPNFSHLILSSLFT
jgi:hypothetical protein